MTDAPAVRTLFFGSPEFALPSLESLRSIDTVKLIAVVTQPDKPAGRGNVLTPPPVKLFALEHQIECLQPTSLRFGLTLSADQQRLRGLLQSCDLAVVVAYGKIIPVPILSAPRLGVLNVHPSKLPRWRGAAPIERSLFAGDRDTAVAIMRLTEGLDCGPVYVQEPARIEDTDNTGTLLDRLSKQGARLLAETIPQIVAGTLHPVDQIEDGVTYANKWEAADCQISWDEPADVSWRRVRTCAPFLGARTLWRGQPMKIFAASLTAHFPTSSLVPGTISAVNREELLVCCGAGASLSLTEVQFAGKKRLPIRDVLNGGAFTVGARFGV